MRGAQPHPDERRAQTVELSSGLEIVLSEIAVVEFGVSRDKAAFSSGWKSHPATAPAGSNRSSHGGNEVAEAFD
jgi:hypothetical protein